MWYHRGIFSYAAILYFLTSKFVNSNSTTYRYDYHNDNNHNRNGTPLEMEMNIMVNSSFNFTGGQPGRRIPDEQRLLNKVFRNKSYDNSVRPVFNATKNVVVKFGLTLIQIMDMDEKNQVLITNVWLEHEWKDERIKWSPKEYNNLHVIRIPAHKLWLPDIVLYNNADDYTTGYMPSNAMVSFEGDVFWSPPARMRSSCKVDTTFFPFDEQKCSMKFGSWTYDQAQVDIVNKSEAVDMSNYITNGEWALKRAIIDRNEVIYPIGDAIYPDVTVTFVMHRRILYYILNILCPCIWLNVLSLLAFCLPPDAGEKVTLGITVLLSYSVFMLLVAENMPPTSEFVPLVGIYLTISMAVTSISVIFTVCVLKLHHCGPHQTQVPNWIRFLVLKVMGRIVNCHPPPPPKSSRMKKAKQRKANKLAQENAEVCLRLVNECNMNKHSPVAEFRNNANSKLTSRQSSITDLTSTALDYNSPEWRRLTVMEEILKYLKIMVAKRDEDDNEVDVVNEWRQVAQVMDRFLFWFFMIMTVAATLVIMVIIPMYRYRNDDSSTWVGEV